MSRTSVLLQVPDGPPPALDHERLEVYQVARALTKAVAAVLGKVPARSGHADALDDLRRAVRSVAHNIAEGSGEHVPREKAKFCRYARRSATECASGLDYLVDFEMIREEDTWPARWLIHRCVSMLVRLIQSLEARAARETREKRPGHAARTGPARPRPESKKPP